MRPRVSAWALLAALLVGPAQAGSLGVIGPTYEIAEPNFLDFIMKRLKEAERSGKLAEIEESARRRATTAINSPPAVAGLKTAEVRRTFYFDPSVHLTQNVVDATGRVLYPAGTVKNPLDVVSMSKHLLFFDGRDRRQVERAQALIRFYGGRVKPILVAGSYMDLMKAWQVPVFYDQGGRLVARLGITAVPALVSQEAKRLRIDELAPQ